MNNQKKAAQDQDYSKKYDRQIRLWGLRGQKLLRHSKIALVNCTGTGIEAIKNLILPGVGTVDIWDESVIRVQDLSSSFFFEQDNVGQSKAEVASKNLLEMNPDVHGSYFKKSLSQFLSDETAIKKYNLVLFGGNMNTTQLSEASKKLWQLKVPCIFATVAGFFFYIRSQKQQHYVQFSNTIAKKYDLRISDPFPELEQYYNKHNIYQELIKLEKCNNQEQKNEVFKIIQAIPYSVILAQVYKKLPQEKRKLNFLIEQMTNLEHKVPFLFRKNIDQGKKFAFQAFQTPDRFMIDIQILNSKPIQQCSKDSPLIAKFLFATKKILDDTGKLPNSSIVPDMTANTVNFVDLKNLYKQKHQNDILKIKGIIKDNFGGDHISDRVLSDYINHLYNMELIHMKSYAQELEKPETGALNWMQNEKNLLISIKTFQDLYDEQKLQQIKYEDMKQHALKLKSDYGIQQFDERYIKEVFRSKGQSDINIESMAGAIMSQEAIKIISGCFSPMNGGFFFDGAHGRGYQVKL